MKTINQFLFFIIVSCCLFATANAQITNQRLYDTVPNMVAHYQNRVAIFIKEPVVTGKIIFLGNSITEGGNWPELTGNRDIINRGIGGDVTFGILQRLDDIIVRKPSKLFLLIGINDISKDFPEEVIADNCRKIVEKLRLQTPSTKVYVQSVLPLNPQYPKFPQHYNKADHVLRLNKLLQELCVKENIAFINLFPLFLDNQQRLDARYTYDGLHLNGEGYSVWAKFLKDNGYL